MDSFQKVQKIYAAELFGGKISKFYDDIFNEVAPNLETQKNILGLLYDSLTLDREKTPIESWRRHTGLSEIRFLPDNAAFEYARNCSRNFKFSGTDD